MSTPFASQSLYDLSGRVVARRRGKEVTVGGRTVELMTENEAKYLMMALVSLIRQVEQATKDRT